MGYSLYIVACADGTLYTGIATDLARRLLEHNGGNAPGSKSTGTKGPSAKGKGARYTSARRPVALVYEAAFATRSEAAKEEARIKRLTRAEKEQLISIARDADAQRS